VIWGAVIVAAGRGARFGRPKQLLELAGKPMVAWSIATFAGMPEVCDIVVVTEADFVETMEAVAVTHARTTPVRVVAGGADRQASAYHGICALPEHCAGIFVHDGARPLVRAAEVRAGMRAVKPGVGSLLAAPVTDTVKVTNADGKVLRTLERSELWAAQTPQLATARELRRAHGDAERLGWPRATDDAALLERAGLDVFVVPASPDNIKVTHPHDFEQAAALLEARAAAPPDDDDLLLVECFVSPRAVDAVIAELEARAAHIDAIDRDLPAAVAVRAFANTDALRGFGVRLHALAGEDALFTTHLSHAG
jgi:2-C-methyl-D-erythritol 4-phosphate cytidylyltransferase